MTTYITIPGFEKLTQQEMFDISARHILATGKPSVNEGSTLCVYAGSGCAAAPFIREDQREIADGLDTSGWGTGWQWLSNDGHVPKHEDDFVVRLQLCHDDNAATVSSEEDFNFMELWEDSMRILAAEHGLSTAVLD